MATSICTLPERGNVIVSQFTGFGAPEGLKVLPCLYLRIQGSEHEWRVTAGFQGIGPLAKTLDDNPDSRGFREALPSDGSQQISNRPEIWLRLFRLRCEHASQLET
jgi:hypothetical protein